MGKEINLLKNYPRAKRNISEREKLKSEQDRIIARKFGKEFFDGDRAHGYGGFIYNSKFWQPVIHDFKNYWNLNSNSSILDVGCAKGFMLYDFSKLIPGITLKGVDISEYAINNAMPEVKKLLQVANAKKLPFPDNYFDVVISINTIHNLEPAECKIALQEISRVSKKNSFVTVDAYRNNVEKERIEAWNLTARTICHVDAWREIFSTAGYTGDYYWFFP